MPYPLFSHFQGGGRGCPWHQGDNENPERLRGQQYHGQQESQAHRLLCEQIAALSALDNRHISAAVNAYRPPTAGEYGRFPDVAIQWRDFPECIFEVQLSRTFQTEISARCTHYEREGAELIWVLFGFDPQIAEIPQNFLDVIRRHRGNAFIIDKDSVSASSRDKTIILKCYLQNVSGGFDPPVLVRLDQMTFLPDALPFFEDRHSKFLLDKIAAIRRPCFDFLATIENESYGVEKDSLARDRFIEALTSVEPTLTFWEVDRRLAEEAILRLIACSFSIISTANKKPKIYGTSQKNIAGMLNTWLHTRDDIQRCALIFTYLIRHTPLATLLTGTVGQHLLRARQKMEGNLVSENEPEWRIMSYLVPEIFDPRIRDQLKYLSRLPDWAKGVDVAMTSIAESVPQT